MSKKVYSSCIKCSAPLCPEEKLSLEQEIFYPDEEICHKKDYGRLEWIKAQRKIKRKAKDDTYFTYEMLNRKCIIRKGIKGLNPMKAETPQLKKWLHKHPKRKQKILSPEYKAKMLAGLEGK